MKVRNYFLMMAIAVLPLTSCQGQTSAKKETAKSTGKSDIEHLTSASFKQKVFDYSKNKEWKFAGNKPCIIDFYASWCGPCRAMAPTIEQIAKEYKGKIDVYKVDVDAQQELAGIFGVQSIPSILFCPAANKPQMSQGLMSKADFDKTIKELLKVSL